jgi:1A family penicillin-binding protein
MPIDHFKKLKNKKPQVWKNSKVGSSKYKQNKRIKKIKKRAKLFQPSLNRTYQKKKRQKLFPKHLQIHLSQKANNKSHYSKKHSKKKKYSSRDKLLLKLITKKLITFGIILILIGIIFTTGIFAWYSRNLPDPNKIIDRTIAQSTKIYDRLSEKVLYDIHGNERRTLIDINELPEYVIHATIAMEDKNFYHHKGISIWGIIRGQILPRLRGQRAQGGSTLTQQFVKNAVLTNERSLARKIKEWILSYQIEKKYSKNEILSMYFNEIPYGSVAYGVESAANIYFDKSAKDLSIAESAILAALPQAPTYYSPYGSHKDELIGRQQYIIGLMAKQGYITEEDAELAKQEEIEFTKQRNNISAPHFVFYVKEKLNALLGERFVEQAGLKVITTLDYEKQEIAEKIINEKTENYPETYNANNAALLSLDPQTGDILTMIGSRDFFDEEIDGQVNVTLASRQPGSSIKPFIYTLAFEKGYQPQTILFDVETLFKTDSDDYEPVNYDLETHGPVSLRKALAGSLNIPAVKVMYLVGIEDTLKLLKDFGYTTIKKAKNYGLSLVLGGLEVKMIEHTNAFATLARNGIKKPTRSILRVEDANGEILYEAEEKNGKRVMEEKIVKKTNSILSDNVARSYIFGENNYLTLGNRPVAAKTGTTNDFNDAWTIGFTPHIVTSVWIGNNNNEKMIKGAAGGALAAPIWKAYMQEVAKDHPTTGFDAYEIDESIEKPMLNGSMAQQTKVNIDTITGLLATDYTPPTTIQEKIFYKVHSILHYLDKNAPLGPMPNKPETDPNYETWESAVLKWVEEDAGQEIDTSDPPTEYDNIHTLHKRPTLIINYPLANQEVSSPNLNIQATAHAKNGNIDRVIYYIDGKFIGSDKTSPYQYNYNFSPLFKNGHHELKIIAFDQQENFQEIKIPFMVNIEHNTSYNLNWIIPQENAIIKQDDFPLNLQINIDQISLINKIDFYYIDETTGQSNWIQTISNPLYSSIDVDWTDLPIIGSYVLHTIITDFENNVHRGPGINIIIE